MKDQKTFKIYIYPEYTEHIKQSIIEYNSRQNKEAVKIIDINGDKLGDDSLRIITISYESTSDLFLLGKTFGKMIEINKK